MKLTQTQASADKAMEVPEKRAVRDIDLSVEELTKEAGFDPLKIRCKVKSLTDKVLEKRI